MTISSLIYPLFTFLSTNGLLESWLICVFRNLFQLTVQPGKEKKSGRKHMWSIDCLLLFPEIQRKQNISCYFEQKACRTPFWQQNSLGYVNGRSSLPLDKHFWKEWNVLLLLFFRSRDAENQRVELEGNRRLHSALWRRRTVLKQALGGCLLFPTAVAELRKSTDVMPLLATRWEDFSTFPQMNSMLWAPPGWIDGHNFGLTLSSQEISHSHKWNTNMVQGLTFYSFKMSRVSPSHNVVGNRKRKAMGKALVLFIHWSLNSLIGWSLGNHLDAILFHQGFLRRRKY